MISVRLAKRCLLTAEGNDDACSILHATLKGGGGGDLKSLLFVL
jgi:hypothetical protein